MLLTITLFIFNSSRNWVWAISHPLISPIYMYFCPKIDHDQLSLPVWRIPKISDLQRSDLISCFNREYDAKLSVWLDIFWIWYLTSGAENGIRSTGRPDAFLSSPGPLTFISKGNKKEKMKLKKNSSIEDWSVVGQHCPCHNKHNEKKKDRIPDGNMQLH